MSARLDDRGYTFAELDREEARMRREDEVEERRLAADDEWVDRVVAEQEALEAQRKAAAPPAAPRREAEADADDQRWAAALAPFGLALTVTAECGRGLAAAPRDRPDRALTLVHTVPHRSSLRRCALRQLLVAHVLDHFD